MNNQIVPGAQDTISLKEAEAITTNWRAYIQNYEPADKYIRAFNIPMVDITELAEFYKCTSVRAYLAMEIPGDISTLKIILVPVDPLGNDILSIPGTDDGAVATEQSTIYDLTSPCPQICDINSPLFQS
ncbi:hypothetical protein [Ferruginibacter sp. SUN106]|uniref:hypothetical protein n=1 Tax=Ferruginibacter sp. SUN106 TaxID=2978348 RepID=UPI003D359D44